MCLSCAVPVRGGTLGTECLARVLGPDAPEGHAVDHRPPGDVAFRVGGAAFLAGAAASAVPWTNSLTSSHVRGFFGSWETSPVSWALASAIAAALGLAGWLLVRLRPSMRGAPMLWLLAVVGVVAAAGAVMFLASPPFATHPFLGPWLMIAAAGISAVACGAAAVRVSAARGAVRRPLS
jgi:hypothetical protein